MFFTCSKLSLILLLFTFKVEFRGTDGHGGPLYVGSGCFHRRDILCGRKFGTESIKEPKKEIDERESVRELEEKSKGLASCTFEQNTQWGKEVCPHLFLYVAVWFSFLSESHS